MLIYTGKNLSKSKKNSKETLSSTENTKGLTCEKKSMLESNEEDKQGFKE